MQAMLVENLNIVKGGKCSRYGRSTALHGSLHAMLNQQHLGCYSGGTTFTLLSAASRVGGWVAILINPRNAKLGLGTSLIYLFIFLG